MFDPVHLAYVAAGLVIGWLARSKMSNLPAAAAAKPAEQPVPADPLDAIIGMVQAEQARKSKLDQLRDILTPKA